MLRRLVGSGRCSVPPWTPAQRRDPEREPLHSRRLARVLPACDGGRARGASTGLIVAASPPGRSRAAAELLLQCPVSACGACTGFDSGDQRCRRYTASQTIEAMARNSLCQF